MSLIDAIIREIAELPDRTSPRAYPGVMLVTAEELRAILTAHLNTPELEDFAKGAVNEAVHQVERWGTDHDAGKTPTDWFWLIGYLAGKAAASHFAGDVDKALHHCITTAAAMANWHRAIKGTDNRMRPGIETPIDTRAVATNEGDGSHVDVGAP